MHLHCVTSIIGCILIQALIRNEQRLLLFSYQLVLRSLPYHYSVCLQAWISFSFGSNSALLNMNETVLDLMSHGISPYSNQEHNSPSFKISSWRRNPSCLFACCRNYLQKSMKIFTIIFKSVMPGSWMKSIHYMYLILITIDHMCISFLF